MASRRLRNGSYSVVSHVNSDHSENMEDSNVTCFESDAEVIVRENPALEQAEQNTNIVVTSNCNITICTNSNINESSMSATQLQEFLSTLKQTIQSFHSFIHSFIHFSVNLLQDMEIVISIIIQ